MDQINIPRVRTLVKCVEALKQADPDCPFTIWTLRTWIKHNILTPIWVGNTIYINLDDLEKLVAETKVADMKAAKERIDSIKTARTKTPKSVCRDYGNIKIVN